MADADDLQNMQESKKKSNQNRRQRNEYLAQKAREGDLQARETLITEHLYLVDRLIGRFAGKGVPNDVLYQEGCYGLIMAVDRYDPKRNTLLDTYATYYVNKYLWQAMMDNYCESLSSLDVATKAVAAGTVGTESAAFTAWDVSLVKTMTATFIDCENITFLNVSDWTTTALVNTIRTFDGCVSLATLDVSDWNMSSVRQAYSMFTDCESLEVIDVSNWDTSSLYMIENYVYSTGRADLGMFENCTSLKAIDLSNWNMSQITNTAHMFYNCTSLESIIIPASAAYISAEFAYNCPNLVSITFLHGANDSLNMPEAGEKTADLYPSDSADENGVYSDGGAFYVPSSVKTTVISNGNLAVAGYDWATDNRS